MVEKRKLVIGVFRNRGDAEAAYDYLKSSGYADREINALMSDRVRASFYPELGKETAGTKAPEGAAIGGAVGTAVGAALAAVVAIGTSVAIPGLGLIIAGPLAAGLAGGGAGAVAGGVIGLLAGAGITDQNAKAYEAALRSGGVVLGVAPRNSTDASAIQKHFKELNGENVVYT